MPAVSATPTPFQGLWIPLVTPFHDGAVDHLSLARMTKKLAGQGITDTLVVDFVGFGTTASSCEGAAAGTCVANVKYAPAPSTTTADFRAGSGCTDTNVNSADFSTAAPSPRNTSTTPYVCSP